MAESEHLEKLFGIKRYRHQCFRHSEITRKHPCDCLAADCYLKFLFLS